MLLVFGRQEEKDFGDWAKFLPNHDIKEIIESYHDWFDELININLIDYSIFILVTKDVWISDNPIFMTFSLAHELEHAVQYLEERILSLQAHLIISYLKLSNQWNNSTYNDFPPEMDASRTAKKINFLLHGENETLAFIDKRISESAVQSPDSYGKSYWRHIRSLELEVDYDWKSLIRERWTEYEDMISRMKCASEDFLKEYEYYETIVNMLSSTTSTLHPK